MAEPAGPLAVTLRHRLGTLTLDVAFTATAPWTVLFGASGSGKSTVLRAVAGLLRPDLGRITIGRETVFDSARRVFLPPHHRPIRWAGQTPALFPRHTVRQNIAFGAESKLTRPADSDSCDDLLALLHFGILDWANLKPHQLSHGQQQVVSVVRAAFGAQGKVLLLDEPFTGLDRTTRDGLIANLKSFLSQTQFVCVTHDVEEAFLLEAEVIRLHHGRLIAQGAARDVLATDRAALLQVLTGRDVFQTGRD